MMPGEILKYSIEVAVATPSQAVRVTPGRRMEMGPRGVARGGVATDVTRRDTTIRGGWKQEDMHQHHQWNGGRQEWRVWQSCGTTSLRTPP